MADMQHLIVQTSFLGDMVLTTPLIASVATRGDTDVVCTPAAATLLANNPSIRDVIAYDKRGADRGVGGFLSLAGKLRRRGYDSAYMAQGSVRSGSLALAAGIPSRVGFETSAGRLFYTRRVSPEPGSHHAARLLLLAGVRVDPGAIAPRLYPGADERRLVEALLGAVHVDGEPLLALAPGSVWGTKRWPHFPALAAELGEFRPVVVGSRDDAPLAAEIVAATNGRAIDATGRLSLLSSAELIGRAAVLVSNDTAPLHLASAMQTPTVALFGPTVPAFGFGPLAAQSAVVEHPGLACRPCGSHGPRICPLGHWRCMREITAASVATTVRHLLRPRDS
jgi:lipopolysaccharide heptosyltransferase II